MAWLVRLRILFYISVLAMFLSNMLYMRQFRKANPSKDERLLAFQDLELRFFTIWTVMLHMAYACFGLFCDFLLLKNASKKSYNLPQAMGDFREIVFAGLVWPCSLVVFSVFWGLYAIDRNLIFPEFLDAVIPPISNHVIHTMILPIVLFEVLFRPRKEPETHARNVAQLTLHLSVYLCVLLFTHKERGIWLYPIFRQLYGTIYFPLALAGAAVLFYIFYYTQWPITNMIHGSKKTKETKVVFSVFWGLYAIDRNLIFPEFLDAVIPPISNHVIHTMILPIVLFEVLFRPRKEPETHARNVAQLTLHLSVYLCVLLFTHKERGIWLYPIFRQLYGTIYFPLALAGAAVLFYIFYYTQWPITNMIHGSKKTKETKVQKVDKKKKTK